MLKIGIVGLGRGSSYVGLVNARADARVTAVCDVREEVRTQWAERLEAQACATMEELCASEVDAIVVATPPVLHAKHCIMAMEAGKHVLSEVPAVWSIEDGRQLVEAVRRTGMKYMFAENMCYFHYLRTMQRMVQEGKIGEIIYAEAEYIHDLRGLLDRPDGMGGGVDGKPSWRAVLPPIHYCSHDLGPILMMMKDRVVSASGLHTGARIAPELGAIDMEVGIFKTAGGAVIKILCGFVVERPGFHWISLYGTRGSLEMDRFAPYEKLKAFFTTTPGQQETADIPVTMSDPDAPPEATAGGHGTSEYYMVDDFVRCIREDTKPAFDVYEGLDYSLPGICAHLSAERGGEAVEVPDPRRW
jgi:predicted dehydrogenase